MSLTLFPLKFMCAVSFVFALFLSVCYWDYGLGIMVWGLFFFALGWESITVSGSRVSFGGSGLAGYQGIGFDSLMGLEFAFRYI